VPAEVPHAPWQGSSYGPASGHHRAADEWFLARHRPSRHDVVVDLGCGTGEFTAELAALVPDGRVVGIDSDASMLQSARRLAAGNLAFVLGAAEAVDEIVDAGSVDLVVSRAMLHWLPAAARPRFFAAALRVLRPGGVLHVEGAAVGNIHKVNALLADLAQRHHIPPPPPFPDTGEVFEEVEQAGFDVPPGGVHAVAQRRRFTEPQLAALLRSQAVLVLTRHVSAEVAVTIERQALEDSERLRRHDGTFDQTFVRLDVLARRP
jgi:SAM-dependent methyltransferase